MKDYENLNKMREENQFLSSERRAEIDFKASIIGKMIKVREEKGLSQRELAEISGVKQPAIARMESLKSIPQIDTLLKVLIPLGYTLEIVPLYVEDKK